MSTSPSVRARGVLVALALAAALAGCGDAANPDPPAPGPMPADPEQWVCRPKRPASDAEIAAWCREHPDRGDPVPADLRNPPPPSDFAAYNEYNQRLQQFLTSKEYESLGWVTDLDWRLSGPSVIENGSFGHNYGPHFPLKVYYSPEVVDWLCNGREGEIPDGAMIMKAMTLAFDQLGIQRAGDGCMDITADPATIQPQLWAPMLKASGSSYDGWLWALPTIDLGIPPQFPPPLLNQSAFTGGTFPDPIVDDAAWYPTGSILQSPVLKVPNVAMLIPLAGHPYCLSCHATAQSESTFASMENILGRQLRYKAYDPPPNPIPAASPGPIQPFPRPLASPSQPFLRFFDQIEPVGFADVWETRMPAETYDQQVISAHDGPGQFVTSAQCNACHNATPQSPLLPQMVLVEEQQTGRNSPLRNLSPYGEWRVSPMGLSGRDPVFFAQLQSETNHLSDMTACIESTCLHCHGAMGAREFAADTSGAGGGACEDMFAIPPPPEVPFGQPFRREFLQQWPGGERREQQYYAALARDGVSCTVCHHVADVDLGQERTFTGNFVTGPADEIYGPYADDTIVTKPMQNALGLTPKQGLQIGSPDLCGSCHNVLLPVFENSGQRLGASYEQSTHLEWTNSDFAHLGSADYRTCQDCHMPTQYRGTPLEFKIANSESNDQFPPTTNRLPDDEIELTTRDKFSRHSLHGLNLFLNQLAQQFPLLMGVMQIDWMSEQPSPIDPPAPPFASGYPMELPLLTGMESMLEMARQDTAAVEVGSVQRTGSGLQATVTVRNRTGHYLPTGVSFRRMFVELLALDGAGEVLWASGRTNDLGFILDGVTDEVLPSEQPTRFPAAPIQPHYQTIVSGDQVQIYQELIRDSSGELTTSFLRRVDVVKDNRVRPRGFDPQVFARSDSPFIRQLAELHGDVARDPHYFDPSLTGSDEIEYHIALPPGVLARADRVQATLYYQSIPPFFLQQRFADASVGPGRKDDIERLHYMASHLDVAGARDEHGETVLEGWKIRIAGDAQPVR